MADPGKDALASVAVFALSAAVSALPQFLPKLSEVHRASENSDLAADVRVGEVATTGFVLVLGAIAASITGSSAPFKASILLALFIVATYETALRGTYFRMGCNG